MCAKSDQNFTVGLIVPNEKQLRLLMKKEDNGDVPEDFHALCKFPKAVQAVTKAVNAHAVQCKYCTHACTQAHGHTHARTHARTRARARVHTHTHTHKHTHTRVNNCSSHFHVVRVLLIMLYITYVRLSCRCSFASLFCAA